MGKVRICLICLVLAVPCAARTITVDDDGPADFSRIQKAINASSDNDIIIVSDGLYRGPGNRDMDFRGKAITLKSKNGPENCIIDCNGTQAEPHRAFYFHSGEDANSIIKGFTIRNGYHQVSGGGTAETSKSYFGKPVCEIIVAGDINGDCEINFKDFFFIGLHWLGEY